MCVCVCQGARITEQMPLTESFVRNALLRQFGMSGDTSLATNSMSYHILFTLIILCIHKVV